MKQISRNGIRFCQTVKLDPYNIIKGKRISDSAKELFIRRTFFVIASLLLLGTGIFFMFF